MVSFVHKIPNHGVLIPCSKRMIMFIILMRKVKTQTHSRELVQIQLRNRIRLQLRNRRLDPMLPRKRTKRYPGCHHPRVAQRDVAFKRSGSGPSFIAFMLSVLRRNFCNIASKQAVWSKSLVKPFHTILPACCNLVAHLVGSSTLLVKRACLPSNFVKLFRQIVEAIEKGEYDGQKHVF
jgi:hypothetical protein